MAHAGTVATGHHRPASRLRFATILFLASELLFFGGLFAAYFTLRAQTTPWPPAGVELDTVLSAAATAILLASSFTFHAGISAAGKERQGSFRVWTVITLALGAIFLGIQIYDWLHIDFGVSTHAYGTMYIAMTGLHGLHVAAGLALMLVVLGRSAQGAFRHGRVDALHASGYYWHFVDVVWIGLFLTIFVLR
jgi:cytochrome c oxidase subunit 3